MQKLPPSRRSDFALLNSIQPSLNHGIIANVKAQRDMIVIAQASDGVEALVLITEQVSSTSKVTAINSSFASYGIPSLAK
jgi:hypothetical protein